MSLCCLFGSSDEEQIRSQKHVMVIQPFYELEISRIAVLFLRTEVAVYLLKYCVSMWSLLSYCNAEPFLGVWRARIFELCPICAKKKKKLFISKSKGLRRGFHQHRLDFICILLNAGVSRRV